MVEEGVAVLFLLFLLRLKQFFSNALLGMSVLLKGMAIFNAVCLVV